MIGSDLPTSAVVEPMAIVLALILRVFVWPSSNKVFENYSVQVPLASIISSQAQRNQKEKRVRSENTREPMHVSYYTYKIPTKSPFPHGASKKKKIARVETHPGPRDPRFWDKDTKKSLPQMLSPQSLEFQLWGQIAGVPRQIISQLV